MCHLGASGTGQYTFTHSVLLKLDAIARRGRGDPSTTKLSRILRAESQTTKADGFVRDLDAALQHDLMDVMKAEAETKVPDVVRDDFGGEAVAAVAWCGRDVHPFIESRFRT